MKTWQTIWRLLLYRPWLVLACLGSWILISMVPVALGLVARAFFDALSGAAAAASGLWWLVVLPVMVQSMRLLVTWISVPLHVTQRFSVHALLSRNLFAQILKRPGALALTGTSGEAISRFREDVDEAATFVSLNVLISVAGECLTVSVILGLLVQINAFVTVTAVCPCWWSLCLRGRQAGASIGTETRVAPLLGRLPVPWARSSQWCRRSS